MDVDVDPAGGIVADDDDDVVAAIRNADRREGVGEGEGDVRLGRRGLGARAQLGQSSRDDAVDCRSRKDRLV